MRKEILQSALDAVRAIELLQSETALTFIEKTALLIVECFQNQGKVLIAGNGGSLADAMHFAEELTGYYREKRTALPAIALGDPCHMSCVANDASFDAVFSRMVEALGRPGDILIVLSTSGNSKNILQAAKKAAEYNIPVVGFLGKGGGVVKAHCDICWSVEGFTYSDRIQEAHMAAIHIIIEMVEKIYFYNSSKEAYDSLKSNLLPS